MSQPFTSVSVIGSGNVATHISRAFSLNGIKVSHVHSRTKEKAQELATKIGASACELEVLPIRQLTVVCVSDDSIADVIDQLPKETPVVYTSGSVGIDQIPEREYLGVFYPLQTLSKTASVDYSEIPILVESENPEFQDRLLETAKLITSNHSIINSEQRRKLHLAAVWINNFTNHIVHQAQQIAKEQKVDYKLLLPLLKETIQKLEHQSAYNAQTGPARRGDENTISKHINELEGRQQELYKLLSKSIKETYND